MRYTFSLHQTDWGYVAAAWSEVGLWELTFPAPHPEQAKGNLQTVVTTESAADTAQVLDAELKAYFAGTLTRFTTPIDWGGYTPFRTAVLRYTATIPYGEVRTYREAAVAAGSPRAARAAGGALHNNRTPIVIPCHRVIGAGGGLVGFGGGLDMKTNLLKLEKQQG